MQGKRGELQGENRFWQLIDQTEIGIEVVIFTSKESNTHSGILATRLGMRITRVLSRDTLLGISVTQSPNYVDPCSQSACINLPRIHSLGLKLVNYSWWVTNVRWVVMQAGSDQQICAWC